ncbi:diguanylate cyclase domain-containing protein [Nodosilinea sp. E11]|uniref:diguanylate cyclase domain-containing protein n=1 Tax=Nodosilinea sp. E11 TaxID=3037479 RepID=UPI0029346815|nr:diguanylate cyclase [Nodosilinea sp. E11]WOD39506.1 diguanylate cyclase [Nodosilinea sp. E11]
MSMPSGMNSLIDRAPCGFISVDDNGIIAYVNSTLLDLLGWQRHELQGKPIETILPVASRIFYQTHVFPLLRMQGTVAEVYFSLHTRSGQAVPILANGVRRQQEDQAINDCVLIPINQRIQYEDEMLRSKKKAEAAISAQKQAEATVEQQYQRAVMLGQITQHIRQSLELTQIFAVAAQDVRQCLDADRVGIFKFAGNPEIGGGCFVSEAVAPGQAAIVVAGVEHRGLGDHYLGIRHYGGTLAIRDLREVNLQAEHHALLEQFQVRACLLVPLLKGSDLWGLICIHQCSGPRYWQTVEIELVEAIAGQLAIAIHQGDLVNQLQQELHDRQRAEARLTRINTELQQATSQLERLAHTDPLTQIANRRRFGERLASEWSRLSRDRLPLSLLLFDVDYFKSYNDTYGHQQGDDCLYAIAQAAQSAVGRSTDLLARYGGEEFAVILPNTGSQGAITVAQRIHQAVAALNLPHQASAVSDRLTISLGISTLLPTPDLTSSELIQQADQALYRAKHRGRHCTVVFAPDLADDGDAATVFYTRSNLE